MWNFFYLISISERLGSALVAEFDSDKQGSKMTRDASLSRDLTQTNRGQRDARLSRNLIESDKARRSDKADIIGSTLSASSTPCRLI